MVPYPIIGTHVQFWNMRTRISVWHGCGWPTISTIRPSVSSRNYLTD